MSLVVEPLMYTLALCFFTWVTLAIFTRHHDVLTTKLDYTFPGLTGNSMIGVLRALVFMFYIALFGLGATGFAKINQSSTVVVAPSAGCYVQTDADDNLPMQGYNIMAFIYLLTSFGIFFCFYVVYALKKFNIDYFEVTDIFRANTEKAMSWIIVGMLGLLMIFDFIWVGGWALYSPYTTVTYYNGIALAVFVAVFVTVGMFAFNVGVDQDLIDVKVPPKENIVITQFKIPNLLLLMILIIDTYAKVLFFSDVTRVLTYVFACFIVPMLTPSHEKFTFFYKFVVSSMVFWSTFYMFYIIYPDNVNMGVNGFNPTQNNWLYYLSIWCNSSSFALDTTQVLLVLLSVLSAITFVAILILAFWYFYFRESNYWKVAIEKED